MSRLVCKPTHPRKPYLLEQPPLIPIVVLRRAVRRLYQALEERRRYYRGRVEAFLVLPRESLPAGVACGRAVVDGRERLDPNQQQHKQRRDGHLEARVVYSFVAVLAAALAATAHDSSTPFRKKYVVGVPHKDSSTPCRARFQLGTRHVDPDVMRHCRVMWVCDRRGLI